MTKEANITAAKGRHAPAPDRADKPDAPTKIHKPVWKYVFKRTIREFTGDQCTDLAASLTYYMVLALFPALLALVSIVGLFGLGDAVTKTMTDLIGGAAPGSSTETLTSVIEGLSSSSGAGLVFIVGLAGALWSASGYVKAFGRAMNRIYEIEEGRPFWKLIPSQLLVTLIVVVMAAAGMVMLVVSGPIAESIGNVVGLGSTAVTVWSIAKWPVLALFAVIVIALLYHSTSNVKQPKFRWISIGAVIALLVLGVATVGFAFYVTSFGSYNATYGAIGGVIVLLLWFWISNISLLFGAEFDAELERGRELQAGIKAEDTLQLPPRDTAGIEKNAEKNEEVIEQGRRLRNNS
ncbi:YihY/virulence factor BrkB family protein [Arthrobacter roseus]|uniref:YihY/virulence factor BrkB family protein n=1 Tax=Arthrobacter roseus TaxID=136274 RepID=UPI0030842522|nr:membrane protein [Arthrobacter roseus]